MDTQFLMDTYKRSGVTFTSGRGVELFDEKGKRYLDFLAGIAVVGAGHANPEVADAIATQARQLVHVSNIFYTAPMLELAALLREITGWGRTFFCNSGAEANECAIKLARKWAGAGRYKVICADGGFHGRTLATLAATGQPEKWKGFEPLPQGFVHARYNDLQSFEKAIDAETAAILVETIQGERGVVPASKEFLLGLRELATRKKIALIFDEIQTGVGRSGAWWSFQLFGVKPDIFSIAKGLGNGLPIGACIADEPFASAFGPGDHGTTFGAGPIVCAGALATLKYLRRADCLKNAAARGEEFAELLRSLPRVKEVRGHGLMRAAVLDRPCAPQVFKAALARGLVINATSDDTLRFLPPLIVTNAQVREGVQLLAQALTDVA